MKISVVVVNWNGAKNTIECLETVDRLRIPSGIEFETVVVDNGSTDDSLQLFGKITTPVFRILETKTNLGFSGGCNFGISHALEGGADWLLLLNNDTLIDRNFLINFVKGIEGKTNIGIVSPKIYFAPGYEFHKDRYQKSLQGSVLWYAGGKMDWDNVFGVNVGVDDVDRGQYDSVREIDFATGACMVISSKTMKEVGLFNEKYYLYFEDVEFSKRVCETGQKIYYFPKLVIWHKVSQGSAIGGNLNDYYITRNRLIFGMKYASLKTKIALFKEAAGFLRSGRKWQKIGVKDYVFGKSGKGSWK